MKKSILIICAVLITVSLMAIGYAKSKQVESEKRCGSERASLVLVDGMKKVIDNLKPIEPNFNVGSRFNNTITREKLISARTIIETFPNYNPPPREAYLNVQVTIHPNDKLKKVSEASEDEILNKAQLDLLKTTKYSDNILVYSDYQVRSELTGKLIDNTLTYYMTIVPEKEAQFKSGYNNLMKYIKAYSQTQNSNIDQNELGVGKVSFTVTDQGKVSDIVLTSASGIESYDKSMIALVETLDGKWIPAQNSMGENIEQNLILSFGKMGC